MESVVEIWSFIVILGSSFVIGWAAETAQTFIPRALALSVLAWLQTLPEFAVEAEVAWSQQRDLMIANLTGSLKLLVGLGWPMIFFVHYFFQGVRKKTKIKEIVLEENDFLGVLFLFLSILYFTVILVKGSLAVYDSAVLVLIYCVYLFLTTRFPSEDVENVGDLPWIGQKIHAMSPVPKVSAVIFLFVVGGAGLFISVHPFITTLEKWSLSLGISTFVFIQWVAPFLSEFPEKVSAFNWARQPNKAPMAVMNMVSSNINQWTMLAAMIPLTFNLSLGRYEPIVFDQLHTSELQLTIAQSALGGLLLLDLALSKWESLAIFILWLVQFCDANLREEITIIYVVWILWEIAKLVTLYVRDRRLPRAIVAMNRHWNRERERER
jgi:cation:H+ antiporter